MGQTLIKQALVFISTALLYAGPPMLSDDPFVPEHGEFEINIATEIEDRDTSILTAPIFDINYGIYPDVQFTVEAAYISSDIQNDFDAVEIAIKYNFYKGEIFSIALYPQYISYPINTIFNEGEVYALSLPINVSLTDTLNLIINPAYIYSLNEDEHFEFGTYLQYTKNSHNFYLETYIEEAKDGEDFFTLVNIGYLYELDENIGLMGSIGREIQTENKEANIAYLGIQLLF